MAGRILSRAPHKPRTLATTRSAGHWAHALDITDPLGITYPDMDRLRHVAWLAVQVAALGCRPGRVEPSAA